MLYLPGDVCPGKGVAGIGFQRALDFYRIQRITELAVAVEHHVEGWQHEVVDQYVFAAQNIIVAADFYAIPSQTLAAGEEELACNAAVGPGSEGFFFDKVALHVFKQHFHLEPGAGLHGIPSLPEYGFEMHGFFGLESAAVGEDAAVHFVGPVGDVGAAVG